MPETAVFDYEAILAWIIIGGIAGWMAGLIVEGYGFGLIGNIVVGIMGAAIAGVITPMIGLHIDTKLGSIVAATLGARPAFVRRGAAPPLRCRNVSRCGQFFRVATQLTELSASAVAAIEPGSTFACGAWLQRGEARVSCGSQPRQSSSSAGAFLCHVACWDLTLTAS